MAYVSYLDPNWSTVVPGLSDPSALNHNERVIEWYKYCIWITAVPSASGPGALSCAEDHAFTKAPF